MSQNVMIKVSNLSKAFRLPHEKRSSVKSLFLNLFSFNRTFETQRVLTDVSLEVREGEFLGIVGRNGSGKSTLLKLLAGIYNPDEGTIEINGKLTPFIELGVGFNPELTGRENVYLNGALLGFNRKEMTAMYSQIVEFAELERFMDQKLKNYSSGMQVRLAFSIAIRVQSDILLIDEVLAVGDANFQNKCIQVFKDLKAAGKTIIFISHDMGMVRRFCDHAVMLKDGKVIARGKTSEIASIYETENLPTDQSTKNLNKDIDKRANKVVTKISLRNQEGKETNSFTNGDTITLKLKLDLGKGVKNAGVAVYAQDGGYVFGTNTIIDKASISENLSYDFKAGMSPGSYYLKIGLFGEDDTTVYEFFDRGPSFEITPGNNPTKGEGILHLEHSWRKGK